MFTNIKFVWAGLFQQIPEKISGSSRIRNTGQWSPILCTLELTANNDHNVHLNAS